MQKRNSPQSALSPKKEVAIAEQTKRGPVKDSGEVSLTRNLAHDPNVIQPNAQDDKSGSPTEKSLLRKLDPSQKPKKVRKARQPRKVSPLHSSASECMQQLAWTLPWAVAAVEKLWACFCW